MDILRTILSILALDNAYIIALFIIWGLVIIIIDRVVAD